MLGRWRKGVSTIQKLEAVKEKELGIRYQWSRGERMVLLGPCFAKIDLEFLLRVSKSPPFPQCIAHGILNLLLSTPPIPGFSLKVPLSETRGQGCEPVSCTVLPRAVYPQRGLQRLLSRIYGKGWGTWDNGGAQTRGSLL